MLGTRTVIKSPWFKLLLLSASATFAIALSAKELAEDKQQFAKHAASCAAYYFAAARVAEMGEYERLYGAGEYSFNLAVTAVDESTALEQFNRASSDINQRMQKRWADFYKVDEYYRPRCEKLRQAHQQVIQQSTSK